MPTATAAAASEARLPQMTRVSTSRPSSSVPNGCAAEGGLRTAAQLVATGSYGETNGAASASVTKKTRTAAPIVAAGRLDKCRSISGFSAALTSGATTPGAACVSDLTDGA